MTVLDPERFEVELQSLLALAEDIRRGSRREGETLRPLGPKATRTRSAIIEAGIGVFCEQGYPDSSVSDVHERAGVSLGTFYQYFRDKSDLIATIAAEDVIATADRVFRTFEPEQGARGAKEVLDGFVRHYAATADFQRVWEEVTHLEATVADIRRRMTDLLEGSLASSISSGQDDGVLDAALDPGLTARALAAMVDRTCYLTFVLEGRGRRAVPEVTRTLSQLWANALRLEAS